MAIAEMSKCTLVALKSDKDKVYDALQRTGAAQIKTQEEREYTVPFKAGDTSELDRQSDVYFFERIHSVDEDSL